MTDSHKDLRKDEGSENLRGPNLYKFVAQSLSTLDSNYVRDLVIRENPAQLGNQEVLGIGKR